MADFSDRDVQEKSEISSRKTLSGSLMPNTLRIIDPAWAVLKASRIRPGWGHEACGHAQAAGGGARGTS
ncbi:hypothetical protein, partial [Dankookia rubra]|uniref:hypothetical protein n=1 Tax=Dankookia rubra TaxID=1442381 RepID=UPI0019D5BD69